MRSWIQTHDFTTTTRPPVLSLYRYWSAIYLSEMYEVDFNLTKRKLEELSKK